MHSAAEQAAVDLNIKLVLERNLRIRWNKFNLKMVRAMIISVARHNTIPNFEMFTAEIERMLDAHYHFVGRVFIDRINRMVLDEEEKALTPVLAKASEMTIEIMAKRKKPKVPITISRHYKVKAASEAGKITKTTKAQARKALTEARKNALKPGAITVQQVDIASESGLLFRTKLNGRTTGIVRLNTNAPAEAAKLTQIQLLRGEEPSFAGGGASKGTKTWANQADSRVRSALTGSSFDHTTANQTVTLDKPFTVSGEQLRFPGDIGLGASLGNVINCRCSVTFDIKDTVKVRKAKRAGGGSVPNIKR